MNRPESKPRSSMKPETLILLVGANPLPNYLAACALQPARIALVYTKQTTDAKDRLKRELRQALGQAVGFVDPDPFVEDATCATTIRRVIEGLLAAHCRKDDASGQVLLNYTGGTKVMAVHARMAFQTKLRDPGLASYLDEGVQGQQPRLRFDDGTSRLLSEYRISLSLETILALHGITHKPRTPKPPAPTSTDVREILRRVLEDPTLAKTLYDERRRLERMKNASHAIEEPFRAEQHGLSLSLPEIPTEVVLSGLGNREERKAWYRQWCGFIGGEWLEEWVGEQTRRLALRPEPEVTVGVNARRGSREAQLELDVAVVRGQRSYFIACTTDTTRGLCKSKLFEVAVRSRHLGGDLARAALVCLADDEVTAELQEHIADVWGASNTPRVFGLADVREWSDAGDKQPNRYSLETWLES
jgi:Card1-like, endonuclease domain